MSGGAAWAEIAQQGTNILGGVVSSLVQGGQQRKNMRTENMYNKVMADYAYTKDLDMWNKSNAYNSPQQQMERLKEAGLNPQLVYGNGTVAGNQSGAIPKYQAPEANFNVDPMINIPSILAVYQDYKIKTSQNKLLQEQVKNIQIENDLKSLNLSNEIDFSKMNAKNTSEKKGYESVRAFYLSQLAGYSAQIQDTNRKFYKDQLAANLQNTRLRNDILSNDSFWRDAQNELKTQGLSRDNSLKSLEIKMKDDGMTYQDDLFMRMLKQWLDKGRTRK